MVILLVLMFMVPAGVMNAGTQENTAPQPAGSGAVDNEVNTVVIQPNATVGKDTMIASDAPNNHFETQTYMAVGMNTGGEPRGLIQFSPNFSEGEISSARLSFYCIGIANDPMGVNMSAHILTASWNQYGVLWNNRTNDTLWGAPGGDYLTTPVSYVPVSQSGAWFALNITDVVRGWKNGSIPNYGLILTGTPLNSGGSASFVNLASSDYGNPELRPKLTIMYGTEITSTVPPIVTNEDTPVDIDLGGIGHGTVEHISGAANEGAHGLPFWGDAYDECRYQVLYTADEVGAEGKIMRISFEKSSLSAYGNFSNFEIYMAHTDLTSLTDTFGNNYNGFLIEVFKADNVVMNSSDGSRWINFDLNGNFTYDSAHNLLIEIVWQGDGGQTVYTESRNYNGNSRLFTDDLTSSTGTTSSAQPVMKFSVDVQKNGVLDKGTLANFWPFAPNDESSMHQQMLWNHTDIGESGTINKIYFQAALVSGWAVVENLSIRMAHSANGSLGSVFEANHIDPWVEVINSSSYNVSTSGKAEWIEFDLHRPFVYNGNDNIVLDVRWRGGYGNRVYLAVNLSVDYAGQMAIANYSATSANSWNRAYNVRFGFADSPALTWSATSSNTSLFTASVSNNMLHIAPVADAYGSGTVELTLHNDAYSTTQSIPVTINPVNDAPVISGLSAITCTEDVNYTLDMSLYASDVDNSLSDLTFTTDSSYATVDDHNITFNYPEGITSESVNITVEDPGHLTATAELQVTVTQVNDPPQFTSFADALTCDATVPKTYTVSPVDEETADGNFTIFTSSSYATVSGDVITFLYPKGIGSQTVQIYLLDENMYGTQNNISYTLNVSIIDHPEVVNLSSSANHIKVTFDMDMDMASVESAFSMARNGSAVAGTFAWSDARTVTFTPSSAVNGTYDITVGTGAEATTGAAMLSVYSGNYTAPAGLDSDGDGMPDSWEIANGFNPLNSSDAATDADHDGLSNYLEYRDGTQPKNNDTDGDGIVDGFDAAPLTPNDNTGSGAHSASSAFDPMMILVIILLVIVVILAVMLAKKKPGAPAAQEPQPASPMEQAPPAPVEQPVEPAPAGPEAPETPVSYEEPSEPQTPAEGEPSVENSVQAEESETPGEVLDLTEF